MRIVRIVEQLLLQTMSATNARWNTHLVENESGWASHRATGLGLETQQWLLRKPRMVQI